MKKSIEIVAHLVLWAVFVLLVITYSKLYLLASPDAPFAGHFNYVVFLELIMGLIFFYTTFLGIRLTRGKNQNRIILGTVLLLLLVIFAYPATRFGFWQVMSSVVPHLAIIFLAIIFRKLTDQGKLVTQNQIR
jgi:uncharacterized membrane protein YkvI